MSRPDAGRILACLAAHRHVQHVDLNRVAACWPPNDQMGAALQLAQRAQSGRRVDGRTPTHAGRAAVTVRAAAGRARPLQRCLHFASPRDGRGEAKTLLRHPLLLALF